MRTPSPLRQVLLGSSLLCLTLMGCLESTITRTCEDIAQTQCQRCYECGTDDPGLGSAQLCDFDEGTSQAECEAQFTERCEAQSSARQRPGDALDACLGALENEQNLTCEDLYEAAALDRAPTVPACDLFL